MRRNEEIKVILQPRNVGAETTTHDFRESFHKPAALKIHPALAAVAAPVLKPAAGSGVPAAVCCRCAR